MQDTYSMSGEDVPKYSVSTPTCCKVHRESCVKKRDMNTSGWKFLSDDNQRKFEPCKMSSTQHKKKCMELLDQTLERETNDAIMEEMRKEVIRKDSMSEATPSRNSGLKKSESGPDTRKENYEALTNLKEHKMDTNPYLVLLNRLDEEEGVRTPSVEDKLKLMEDRLRVSINSFCEACDELVADGTTNSTPKKEARLLEPEVVREAFSPKVFEPSLRPPQTLSVSKFNKKPMVGTSKETKNTKSSRREAKMKGILKQGFYLPSDTWFTQEQERESLTVEEIELLNSTSTRAFLKFLDERKKEPPKILQEIQKKLQDIQQFEKQNGYDSSQIK